MWSARILNVVSDVWQIALKDFSADAAYLTGACLEASVLWMATRCL